VQGHCVEVRLFFGRGMMTTMPVGSLITYDGLPISSGGGHTVRARSPVETWGQITKFMATCTDNPPPSDINVEVVTGDTIPNGFSGPLLRQLTQEFGSPTIRGLGADTGHIWAFTAVRIVGLLEMIERLRPLPLHPYKLQPISVNVLFQFRLVSPHSGQPLPNQHPACYNSAEAGFATPLGVSQIYVRLSERSTVSLFLSFPFEETTGQFQQTAAFVQGNLPIKLSKFHWKRWQLAKNGRRYIGRKIPAPAAE
jgi:hypothetical protein